VIGGDDNAGITTTGDHRLTEREGGSLMPPPRLRNRGDQALVTRVVHFGCKDSGEFIDPFATVSVVDGAGNLIEATQNTPVVTRRLDNKVVFDGVAVHTQTPLHELPDDAAVVLEFQALQAQEAEDQHARVELLQARRAGPEFGVADAGAGDLRQTQGFAVQEVRLALGEASVLSG
jgi:hypothetical protein